MLERAGPSPCWSEASCRVSSSLRDAPFRALCWCVSVLCVGASRRLDGTLRQSGPVLSNGETTLDVALLRSLRRSSAGRERPREEHCFSGDSKVVARFRHPCFVLVRLEDSTTPYGRGASRRLDGTLRQRCVSKTRRHPTGPAEEQGHRFTAWATSHSWGPEHRTR